MIDHPEDYAGPTEPCGDLSAAPFGGGESGPRLVAILCERCRCWPCERSCGRPPGGWSDSGPVEGA